MLEHLSGIELPEQKFFVFSYRSRKGNRWGSALKRKCFWQTWIKKNGVKGWLKYIDKGSGTVVAKYNDGAAKEEQQNAAEVATAIQEESAVAAPKKFLYEVHEMVCNIGTSHKELVDDFCNAEISKIIVGQSLTGHSSGGGGSRARDEVAERVESKKIETDAKGLMAVINKRIVRPLVLLNFGANARCPTWKLDYEPQESVDSKVERFGKLRKEVGITLSQKQVRDECELDEPADEADTLGGEPSSVLEKSAPEKPEDALDAKTLEFSEKKTLNSGNKLNSKRERFSRLRPSMIRFSDE